MRSIETDIQKLLFEAVERAGQQGEIAATLPLEKIEVFLPKQRSHGDAATNIALILASQTKTAPRKIAEIIVAHLPKKGIVSAVDIAGPGFINFRIHPHAYLELLHDVFAAGKKFGALTTGKGKRVLIEFVSANPTGPLHIGHGRGAIYGDALASILEASGYEVSREYYVNDAGVQMETLGRSVFLRLKELLGEAITFPENCYQGDYIKELAQQLHQQEGEKLRHLSEEEVIRRCGQFAGDTILNEIKQDLANVGVHHDHYFFESELHDAKAVNAAFDDLKKQGVLFEEGGALWFRSTAYGDDKDRVLRKQDGSFTYFAADIAYHHHKYQRGFDRLIDIVGADHGGYVARMKGSMESLGYERGSFDIVLLQLVNLVRSGTLVSMSTRKGEYETLADVSRAVGRDVCRYFFLMRSHNAQLDFDLDLATKQSPENPVYYLQYAHARIASLFRRAGERNIAPDFKNVGLSLLDAPEEVELAKQLSLFPQAVQIAAEELEPHRIAFYLLDLARQFQAYYSRGKGEERYRILEGDAQLIEAKLYLLKNVQFVLQSGLSMLGISAPDEMIREDEEF